MCLLTAVSVLEDRFGLVVWSWGGLLLHFLHKHVLHFDLHVSEQDYKYEKKYSRTQTSACSL